MNNFIVTKKKSESEFSFLILKYGQPRAAYVHKLTDHYHKIYTDVLSESFYFYIENKGLKKVSFLFNDSIYFVVSNLFEENAHLNGLYVWMKK